jgi:hypothetical protein
LRDLGPKNSSVDFRNAERLKTFYEYPGDVDLNPDSELHKKLLQHLLTAVKASYDIISDRFATWKELDEKLSVYVDLSDEEKSIQQEDSSKPVSIVVPISYATRETLLTYWVAAFLKHPIFRYRPSKDPKDLLGVIMLESIIAQDCIRSKVGLDLHTMWSDQITYGFSAVSPTWVTKHAYKTVRETEVESMLGIPYSRRENAIREPVKRFEGNALKTLDPYNCFPDPNVPITDVENMDYFGWSERLSYNKLLLEEKSEESSLFNMKYVGLLSDKTSTYFNADDKNTGRYSKTGINFGQKTTDASKPTDIINIFMWIVPDEFGLSSEVYPELWSFKIAADRVIVEARRAEFDHNCIPVCTMATDSDGHTTIPVSLLEREYPLQHAIDWLWKSRVATIRKTINNMFLVDPSLVNLNDVTDTKFGMIARLRAAAWGKGIKDVMQQLPVQDVTRTHIQDIGFLMGIDSRVFTSDQAKGHQERQGERVSASEARDTRQSFLSKMEKMARIGAMQGHYDIAYQFASNTIQLIQDKQIVQVLGDYKDVLMQEYGMEFDYAEVDPKSLNVDFDVVVQDGNLPSGEYAETWERLLQIASSNPDIYKTLDFTRIWLHIARLLGADNPEDFRKKEMTSRVGTQEEIDKGVQSGNFASVEDLEASQGVEEV